MGGQINNLYVWDVQTGNRRLLAKNASNPKWSSDGKQVCYEGVTGDEVPAFPCVDRNGGKAKVLLLPRSTAYLGGWSPDGRFLAYSEYDSSQESYNVSVLRRGERKPRRFLRLLHGAVELKWSPDGRKIALVENIPHQPSGEYKSRLLVLDVRSGQAKHLWSVLGEVTILRWSKYSDWVVASRYRTLAPGYQQELVATSVNNAKAVVLKAPTERANGFDWREVRKEPMTVLSSRPERVSVRRRRMATYPLTPLFVASSVCEYTSTATQCDPPHAKIICSNRSNSDGRRLRLTEWLDAKTGELSLRPIGQYRPGAEVRTPYFSPNGKLVGSPRIRALRDG